jgi:hypothetical protein
MTTLVKALKEKNKLKLEISQLQKKLNTHNSVMKGNPRPFDLNKLDQELSDKISRLVLLKSAITKANQPVQEKIYRLSEIKGLIGFYKKIPVNEGKSTESYRLDAHEYEVFFNEAVIDERIKKLEIEADSIQDELEAFNHKTNI